ncbi:hypothetical protein NRIC_03980 [Enterococcus florum]|uniref:Uncharacterized protein n=1 Tax=Enterococcus florum TaxID=2480627 RepID=A0A4P5P413_9ENTE|nr:tropomyosin [Enterococcus florum]GCF92507.1 hypothetical protein NRIC_03980 [Enterococcus florum]
MDAEQLCKACDDLKSTSLETYREGIGDKQCKSLQKDTGLNPDLNVLHNNCEDLNNLNDCLIGRFGEDIDGYDDCDWKEYAKDFNFNLWNMIKALICSDCGQWQMLHDLNERLTALEKRVDTLEKRVDTLEKRVDTIEKELVAANEALLKIIEKLEQIGVWDGGIKGDFEPGMGIAGGNINHFGGIADGRYYIRTNPNSTENDIVNGY